MHKLIGQKSVTFSRLWTFGIKVMKVWSIDFKITLEFKLEKIAYGHNDFLLRKGEYASTEWTEAKKEMESPPRLGLGTINIAFFVEWLIYYQSMCQEFRYGNGKILGTQPHPTSGSTSTHCVPNPNLIKRSSNMLF